MIRCHKLLALLISGLFTAGASAAEPDYFSLELEDLLQQRITSSTLTSENIKTVPSSITVYTRADIRRLGMRYLSDLVNFVPGFQSVRNDDSSASYTMSSRGRRVGQGARELLILWDGQRLNDEVSGGTGLKDGLIVLDNVERIEFIRGPASALYGSSAMTGVINIITRSEPELYLGLGNHGQRDFSGQWRGQNEQGWLEVQWLESQWQGESLRLFEPAPNPATPTSIDSSDPWEYRQLYLRAGSGDFSLSLRSSQRRTEQFYVAGYLPANDGYLETESRFVGLAWQPRLSESLQLQGRLYHIDRDFYAHNIATSVAPLPVFTPQLLSDGHSDDRELGTQWVLLGERDRSNWLMGLEWRQPEVDRARSRLVRVSDGSVLRDAENGMEGERTISGYFAQYQNALSEDLALTLGARYDHYSDLGGHTSPRLAVVQQVGDDNSFKLLYSEAFRAPSPSETRLLASVAAVANPNLEPETAKTTELVWVHSLNSGYLNTTIFDMRLQDAVVEIVTQDGRLSWANSSQTITGVELEWQQPWGEHWHSRLALSHLIHPGSKIHTESNSLLGASLSYEYKGFSAALLLNVQSEKIDPNEQDYPANIATTETTRFGGRSIWGAHLSYRMHSTLEWSLHADNILAKDYMNPAGRSENYYGVPGVGRSVTAGVRWFY